LPCVLREIRALLEEAMLGAQANRRREARRQAADKDKAGVLVGPAVVVSAAAEEEAGEEAEETCSKC
jgi:hypothetical protein